MRPTFFPALVNDPFHDPCLYVNCLLQRRALIFDLGDIPGLAAGAILKTSHIFVSHTHLDHFAGFDQVLRLTLGRDKTVHLFGPANFLNNVEGKLAAYTWNLTDNYPHSLNLRVTEIRPEEMLTQVYRCQDRFVPRAAPVVHRPFTAEIVSRPDWRVEAVILDHNTPCLGFSLQEPFHVNINTVGLDRLGLQPGPWLKTFKTAIFDQQPPETPITAPGVKGPRVYQLGELTEQIALITAGQKIVYIADVQYNPENREKIISFARGADHLFMESYFLEKDRKLAEEKHHLTAQQAGRLAGLAGVKRLTTFHYSPRYRDQRDQLIAEAQAAYRQTLAKQHPEGSDLETAHHLI